MKGLLFLKPSLTLYRCPLHRPRALADHCPHRARSFTRHSSRALAALAPARPRHSHRPCARAYRAVRLPAVVLRPLAFSFLQSNSNFDVSLPNLSKRCEGATVPAVAANGRRISASRNWESISNFVVSLPNVSEKNVKGLLFRKQPRTGACFRLSEIGKAFQTLSSACRT